MAGRNEILIRARFYAVRTEVFNLQDESEGKYKTELYAISDEFILV